MSKDDPVPVALVGRAGLVFAYVCLAVALATLAAAIYLLPLDLKAKLFLAAAGILMVSLFAFMAIAAHIVSRPPLLAPQKRADEKPAKSTASPARADADGSHRPR